MTESVEMVSPLPCTICSALVLPAYMAEHRDWHERVIDEVVTSVKVRLADPKPE